MNEVKYYATTKREYISLICDTFTIQTAPILRSYEWDYELGRKDIHSQKLTSQEVNVKFMAKREHLEKLRRAVDIDVINKTPGILHAGEWMKQSYITGIDVDKVTPHFIYGTLKVVLLSGAWYKIKKRNFTIGDSTSDNKDFLDYPFDYNYDYSNEEIDQELELDSTLPSDFKLYIYGGCVNPIIVIGENTYQVNTSIPAGSTLIVDSKAKTVVLRDEVGYEQNMFDNAERGEGKGKGRYIFEPIKPGLNKVAWDNSFGFDIEYYIEESELEWTMDY